MCEASVHVPHRMGERQEHLVVRQVPGYYIKGLYPADKDTTDKRLVCMRGERKIVTIKKVTLEGGAPDWVRMFEGMKDVRVTFQHRAYEDRIYFLDAPASRKEAYITLGMFRQGMLIDFGYAPPKAKQVTGKTGMAIVGKAIREALSTEPKEGEQPPAEPKPGEQEPAKPAEPKEGETAPATPAAARRRRTVKA